MQENIHGNEFQELKSMLSKHLESIKDSKQREEVEIIILKLDECILAIETNNNLTSQELFKEFIFSLTRYFGQEFIETIFEALKNH